MTISSVIIHRTKFKRTNSKLEQISERYGHVSRKFLLTRNTLKWRCLALLATAISWPLAPLYSHTNLDITGEFSYTSRGQHTWFGLKQCPLHFELSWWKLLKPFVKESLDMRVQARLVRLLARLAGCLAQDAVLG